MSGRRSRDKGARGERALVRFLQERGFAAERIPLSARLVVAFAATFQFPCSASIVVPKSNAAPMDSASYTSGWTASTYC